jgi:hypothetical protein
MPLLRQNQREIVLRLTFLAVLVRLNGWIPWDDYRGHTFDYNDNSSCNCSSHWKLLYCTWSLVSQASRVPRRGYDIQSPGTWLLVR